MASKITGQETPESAIERATRLYHSSVGKKVVMATTGLILFAYILGHMVGNLKVFQGPEAFDDYAVWLREMGTPALPEYGLLWAVRTVLLVAVVAHITAAVQLWRRSRAARPQGYRMEQRLSFSYASRTMRWGGVIVGAFVVYHILHLTVGAAHPDFEYGAVYANVVVGFQNPLVAAFYVVAVGALSLHLYHGLWSATQTLALVHPKYERARRPVALGVALVIFIGFISVPLAVLAGILALPG